MAESSKRASYTVKTKLDIVRKYSKGANGQGLLAISKESNVSVSTLRGWVNNREKLERQLETNSVESRRVRRLPGAGRKRNHEELENDLFKWIEAKNDDGLRVKDQYIQLKALNLFEQQQEANPDPLADQIPFKASHGWLHRFKQDRNLVSRRHTTSRKLPNDAPEQCEDFLQKVQATIDRYKIRPKNVFNLDQVPRYFETEPTRTIAPKGARQVLMKKGGSSHKKFTVTFMASLAGHISRPHFLFPKLKNRPSVPQGADVDVNETGMWSDKILHDFINKNIASRPATALFREPTLLILDSYGSHLKYLEANRHRLLQMNIHVIVVPPNMTCILQPLDVAINRSFQAFYCTKYDAYIAQALDDPQLQTKAGNPKVPSYHLVASWTLEWITTKSQEDVVKAFSLCGVVAPENFQLENLHPPLKELLSAKFDQAAWEEQFSDFIQPDDPSREMQYNTPEWFMPVNTASSLYECFNKFKGGRHWTSYKAELIRFMRDLPELQDITDEDYFSNLAKHDVPASENELFAASRMEQWSLIVENASTGQQVFYSHPSPVAIVMLVRLEDFFGLKF
jgi:hypothetical protein